MEALKIAEEVFQVIEGGQTVGTPAEIIQFTSDNGAKTWNVVEKTYTGANGTGFNYWVVALQTLIGETMVAVSAGAAMLTCEVGMLGVALAPALGLTTGYVLYNIAPSFWDAVAEKLINAGETINGKVVALISDNGTLTFSETAIEIFKNELCTNPATRDNIRYTTSRDLPEGYNLSMTIPEDFECTSFSVRYVYLPNIPAPLWKLYSCDVNDQSITIRKASFYCYSASALRYYTRVIYASVNQFTLYLRDITTGQIVVDYTSAIRTATINGLTFWYCCLEGDCPDVETMNAEIGYPRAPWYYATPTGNNGNWVDGDEPLLSYKILGGSTNPYILENGELPNADEPFQTTYPKYYPYEYPEIPSGTPSVIPPHYPVQFPENLPDTGDIQHEAQNPDGDEETSVDYITDDDKNPDNPTKIKEYPQDDEQGDPAEDIEETPKTDDQPDPVNPDPPDPVTPIPPTVTPPTTASSNKLFTVYNPSDGELNSLGAYLWDSNLMEILKKIWQNPLDGIISLIKVYATPSVSGSTSHIILGYLDSGVSAHVVNNQFTTIDCGSVSLPELRQNATDYTPYTSLQIYLPFIGITELNVNEFMGGTISVKYYVDVYTGTCLAIVSVTRTPDTPNGARLYTFTGNCSQQIPLTSGDATGVLTSLIAGVGAGLSIASGGGVGLIAGASLVGKSVTREMFHVSHGGNLSANAGIMGDKKPYLIINRKRAYTANSYNKYYGFPINKTTYMSNCSGFTRIKAIRLKTTATPEETDEIVNLLKNGVIF